MTRYIDIHRALTIAAIVVTLVIINVKGQMAAVWAAYSGGLNRPSGAGLGYTWSASDIYESLKGTWNADRMHDRFDPAAVAPPAWSQ